MSTPSTKLVESIYRHTTSTGESIKVIREFRSDGINASIEITHGPEVLRLPVALINTWLWLLERAKELLKESDDPALLNSTYEDYPDQLVSAARAFSVCPCPSNLATLRDYITGYFTKHAVHVGKKK